MQRQSWQIVVMVAALGLALAGPVRAQADAGLTKMLVESYDLLEAGKLAEAQKIYEQILKQDPGNPLALNNLGAIKVKENKFPEALAYLSQALARAQGYKLQGEPGVRYAGPLPGLPPPGGGLRQPGPGAPGAVEPQPGQGQTGGREKVGGTCVPPERAHTQVRPYIYFVPFRVQLG